MALLHSQGAERFRALKIFCERQLLADLKEIHIHMFENHFLGLLFTHEIHISHHELLNAFPPLMSEHSQHGDCLFFDKKVPAV